MTNYAPTRLHRSAARSERMTTDASPALVHSDGRPASPDPSWERDIRLAGGDYHLAAHRRINRHGVGDYRDSTGAPLSRSEAQSMARTCRRTRTPIYAEEDARGRLIVAAGYEALRLREQDEQDAPTKTPTKRKTP